MFLLYFVPGTFTSMPPVEAFPFRSRVKVPNPPNPNQNQSVTSRFLLGNSVQPLLEPGNRIRSLSYF